MTTDPTAVNATNNPAAMNTVITVASSVQWWNNCWQLAGVVLLALTFGAGLGTVITGRWLNAEQEDKIRTQALRLGELEIAANTSKASQQRVEIDLSVQSQKTEAQRQRAAESERELLELKRFVTESRNISMDSIQKMSAILSAAPTGVVTIDAVPSNKEAGDFAWQLKAILGMMAWTVESGQNPIFPKSGMLIEYWKEEDLPIPEPVVALREALFSAGKEVGTVEWDKNIGTGEVLKRPIRISIGPRL